MEKLPPYEFRKYLEKDPLELSVTPTEAKKLAAEGEVEQVDALARKACRLVIEACEKSDKVMEKLGDVNEKKPQSFNKFIKVVGAETPEIAREINELEPSPAILGWAIASSKHVFAEHFG